MEVEKEWEGEESENLIVRQRRPKGVDINETNGDGQVHPADETSVYLDGDKGLWKCRYCVWIHPMGTPAIDHVHDHQELSNGVINSKTWQNSCFGLQCNKDYEVTGEIERGEFRSESSFGDEKEMANAIADSETEIPESQNGVSLVADDRSPEHRMEESQSSSLPISYQGLSEDPPAEFEPIDNKTGANTNGSQANGADVVVVMDVEKVIEEQETHDLFCPNCRSCITKRVILVRKRKRIARDPEVDRKREKTLPLPQPVVSPDAPVDSEPSHEADPPEVFRCLSCFSFFIPTASGFRLFPGSERNDGSPSLQSQQEEDTKNLNCISSIIELFKGKRAGNVSEEPVQPLLPSQNVDSSEALTSSTSTERNARKDDNSNLNLLNGSSLLINQKVGNGEQQSIKDLGNEIVQNGESNKGKQIDNSPQTKPTKDVNDDPVSSNFLVSPKGEGRPGVQEIVDDMPDIEITETMKPVAGTLVPSPSKKTLIPQKSTEHVPKDDVKIDIPMSNEVQPRNLDILKCIVYGGLVESITSLGVVSSAAGSDATTLNIVALGLANLFSGLFVIIHNLRDLNKEQPDSNDQGGNVDRYEEALGKRGHFRLHGTIAMLSYILFGLLPPVVYGFSFRRSDNKDYKLIAVAAASLLCIFLLSLGKAYTRKTPKNYLKTIFSYVSMAVMASGLSYVVGEVARRALEKLGWFDASAAVAPVSSITTILDTVSTKSGWGAF